MSTDSRDMLEVLQSELEFVEQGGYGRSVRTPWLPKSPFQDSLSCINFPNFEKAQPCDECHLIDFVPDEQRGARVPCHFIPLDELGHTIDDLELEGNQQKLEEALKTWLRAKIKAIAAARQAAQ